MFFCVWGGFCVFFMGMDLLLCWKMYFVVSNWGFFCGRFFFF